MNPLSPTSSRSGAGNARRLALTSGEVSSDIEIVVLSTKIFVVQILAAFDLVHADLDGLSDPFIVIKNEDGKQLHQTIVCPKTLNPVFNQQFNVLKTDWPEDQVCILEIYDWDLLSNPDYLGEVHLTRPTNNGFKKSLYKVKAGKDRPNVNVTGRLEVAVIDPVAVGKRPTFSKQLSQSTLHQGSIIKHAKSVTVKAPTTKKRTDFSEDDDIVPPFSVHSTSFAWVEAETITGDTFQKCLIVCVGQAKGLKQADLKEPYVRMSIVTADDKNATKQHVLEEVSSPSRTKEEPEPVWNECFAFDEHAIQHKCTLKLSMWDKDQDTSLDRYYGSVYFALPLLNENVSGVFLVRALDHQVSASIEIRLIDNMYHARRDSAIEEFQEKRRKRELFEKAQAVREARIKERQQKADSRTRKSILHVGDTIKEKPEISSFQLELARARQAKRREELKKKVEERKKERLREENEKDKWRNEVRQKARITMSEKQAEQERRIKQEAEKQRQRAMNKTPIEIKMEKREAERKAAEKREAEIREAERKKTEKEAATEVVRQVKQANRFDRPTAIRTDMPLADIQSDQAFGNLDFASTRVDTTKRMKTILLAIAQLKEQERSQLKEALSIAQTKQKIASSPYHRTHPLEGNYDANPEEEMDVGSAKWESSKASAFLKAGDKSKPKSPSRSRPGSPSPRSQSPSNLQELIQSEVGRLKESSKNPDLQQAFGIQSDDAERSKEMLEFIQSRVEVSDSDKEVGAISKLSRSEQWDRIENPEIENQRKAAERAKLLVERREDDFY